MFWFWGPDFGWVAGLISGIFWILVVVAAVLLLRREVPRVRGPSGPSPALRLLEERYARGEISREEFLERRAVLISMAQSNAAGPTPPPPPGGDAGVSPPPPRPAGSVEQPPGPTAGEPTEPLPGEPPAGSGRVE